MQYRAKQNCQFNKRIYRSGDIINFSGKMECPFFVPVNPIVEKKQEEEKVKSEQEQIEEIRAEMDEIGAGYDRRWKLQKMKDALIAAKKEGKKKEE